MARQRATKLPSLIAGWPRRWMLIVLWFLVVAAAMGGIAGDLAGAVFTTFGYALFTLPVFMAAWMLGLKLTEPFAARGHFAQSPWPGGYRSLMATALGLGVFSLGTLALGAVHLMEPAGNAWPVLALPVAGAIVGYGATRRFVAAADRSVFQGKPHKGEWLLVAAAVPVAILLIAATFPPGTLWRSEAHGYDVLEYHLEMPREYALNNSIAPVGHNVYSFLPANVEMLYLLLMQFAKTVLGNDRAVAYIWGAFPAQFCHALLMLMTAGVIALIPLGSREKPWLQATGRAVAVLVFLGIPWTIVTGSLAYNEGGMLLFGTLALGVALNGGNGAELLAGIFLGLAIGCKMTAGVFFALPVALIFAVRGVTDAARWKALMWAVLAAVAIYAPWALRAAVFSGGNPVFPVVASTLGADHWTPEQVDRFAKGHAAPSKITLAQRLAALRDNSVFDSQWSVQLLELLREEEEPATRPAGAPVGTETAPAATGTLASGGASQVVPDPWWRRFGTLWWGIPLAVACAFVFKAGRGTAGLLLAILVLQLAAWLFATHLQARFLLPIAVPLALLAGRGVQGLQLSAEGIPISAMRIVAGTIVVLHCLFTGFLLWPEAQLLNGVRPPEGAPARRLPIGDLFPPPPVAPVLVNVALSVEQTRPGEEIQPRKILLVGDSTAWRYIGEVEYSTVFNGDLFVRNLADPPAEAAWLRERKIAYVLINWTEIARFRATYGFEGTMSVAEMKNRVRGLESLGVVRVEGDEGYEVMRVGSAK